MLADRAKTLDRWYENLLVRDDPDLILAGGPKPSPERIAELFDRWFERSSAQLELLLCDRLNYGKLSSTTKEVGEIALVAAVSMILATAQMHIDPIATAVLLVTRRSLDKLCDDTTTPPPPDVIG